MPATYYTSSTGVKTALPITPHHHDLSYAPVDHTHVTDDSGYIPLNLQNDWKQYGGFGAVAMRKQFGVVYLSGLALHNASVRPEELWDPITTLPVGWRPAEIHLFTTANQATLSGAYTHAQRVDVYPDGRVMPQYYLDRLDTSTWASLDGIVFFAEQ